MSNTSKRLFLERPTAEELVSMVLGEIEPEYPCDQCLKDCKEPHGPNFSKVWCQKAEYRTSDTS